MVEPYGNRVGLEGEDILMRIASAARKSEDGVEMREPML